MTQSSQPEAQGEPKPGWRIWGDTRCAHCCNGDRCDDPTHYDRTSVRYGCPHCLNTGYALWTEAGRKEKAERDALVASWSRK